MQRAGVNGTNCFTNHLFFFVGIQLKSRFQAAQNQIKELRQRLEQMELLVCFIFLIL